jgi:hypothetical protein
VCTLFGLKLHGNLSASTGEQAEPKIATARLGPVTVCVPHATDYSGILGEGYHDIGISIAFYLTTSLEFRSDPTVRSASPNKPGWTV